MARDLISKNRKTTFLPEAHSKRIKKISEESLISEAEILRVIIAEWMQKPKKEQFKQFKICTS